MSPIEDQLVFAIRDRVPVLAMLFDHGQSFTFNIEERDVIGDHDIEWSTQFGNGCMRSALFRQVSILTYKTDFLIQIDCNRSVDPEARFEWLSIECDGHDFHDRTKQQAAYDRARDRELLRIGIPTIRFTGSEIFHSSERCADEVWKQIEAQVDVLARAEHREADMLWTGLQRGAASVSLTTPEEHW